MPFLDSYRKKNVQMRYNVNVPLQNNCNCVNNK